MPQKIPHAGQMPLKSEKNLEFLDHAEHFFPQLGQQTKCRGDSDVGDDVSGIFEPQAVSDQVLVTGTTDQPIEDFLESFGS